MGRKDPGKIRAVFSNLMLPAARWVLSSSSPLLALRSYSSQLRAASLDPSAWLSLRSVAMERLPLGPLSLSITKAPSLGPAHSLPPGGTWMSGLHYTPHSGGLRKVTAISPNVTYARTPSRSLSAWGEMFNPTHVCSDHKAPLAFLLPARQMKDRAQVLASDPSGAPRPLCLCFFQRSSFFSCLCKLWLLLQMLHRIQCWSIVPMALLISTLL